MTQPEKPERELREGASETKALAGGGGGDIRDAR